MIRGVLALTGRRHARSVPGVDLGLGYPAAHRLGTVPQLVSDPDHGALRRPQLFTELEHETNRLILLLTRIPTRRRLPWCYFS